LISDHDQHSAIGSDSGVHSDPFQPFKRDSIDELIEFMTPAIEAILARVDVPEFTTPDLVAALRTDPDAEEIYLEAVRRWGEDDRSSKLVIHGQVIPGVLRKSSQVRWSGFAYGEDDEFAVPAWWALTRTDS
jgi:hypothetical protein